MAVWKQTLGLIGMTIIALAVWAAFVPGAHPFLDRIGLLEPLQRLGITGRAEGAAAGDQGGPRSGTVQVIAAPPGMARMDDSVSAIGTARSIRSVTLAAEISGRVSTLAVASGDYVEGGAPVAELDSEGARIAVDRASLVHDDAARNLARLKRLNTLGSATEAQLQEAELAERSAALALREATYELSRHRISAPVRGWVGILETGVGDLVAAGARIAEIEDRSTLIVEFRVPERVANALRPGLEVTAAPVSEPSNTLHGQISALDNRVDETSRTLRVQATVPNDGDRLRPGMAMALSIDLPGEARPAVDPLSVQWGSEGAFVWVLRGGRAERLPVRILDRGAGRVLVEAAFVPGDLVVSEGMTALRPGAAAAVAGAGPAAPAPASAATGAATGASGG
ncbi:MAG: efflux RND transporter periplasmic adaptor subunit [Paracoccaceae bacterium]